MPSRATCVHKKALNNIQQQKRDDLGWLRRAGLRQDCRSLTICLPQALESTELWVEED